MKSEGDGIDVCMCVVRTKEKLGFQLIVFLLFTVYCFMELPRFGHIRRLVLALVVTTSPDPGTN